MRDSVPNYQLNNYVRKHVFQYIIYLLLFVTYGKKKFIPNFSKKKVLSKPKSTNVIK